MRRAWRAILVVPVGFLALIGCAPQPVVHLTPEAAVRTCEAPTVLELRSRDSRVQSLVLEPAATSRVENRPRQVGAQPLSAVVVGRGTARLGTDTSDVRYTCLIGGNGQALFVDVEATDGAGILAECTSQGNATARAGCVQDLLLKAERGLAEAEAGAIARAREGTARNQRAEVDEPAVTSIGAWRVYRDAECARRNRTDPDVVNENVNACRAELTRERIRELGG